MTSLYILSNVIAISRQKKLRRKKHLPEEGYDERQQLYLGKAYRYGFYTIVLFCIFYSFLEGHLDKPLFEPVIETVFAMSIGCFVIFEYALWHDVFVPVEPRPKIKIKLTADGFVVIFMLLLFLLAIIFLPSWDNISMSIDGTVDILELWIIWAILICLAAASSLVHWIYRRYKDRS